MNNRRRTTVGMFDPAHGRSLPPSALPVPSASKPRFSIAPTMGGGFAGRNANEPPLRVMRPSIGPGAGNLFDPGTVTPAQRRSAVPVSQGRPSELRASAVKRQSLAITPAGFSRRASTFTGRPSSIGLGLFMRGSDGMKDPRPLRNAAYQANCNRILLNYLTQARYPHPVSMQVLQHPTAKDFLQIFKFVYSKLDPSYTMQRKLEEEVPAILKSLQYPFADSITKSSLYAVGSKNSWPNFLGILHWMVELATCVERLAPSNQDFFSPEAQNSPTFNERVFFDYLSKSYSVFLGGQDDFESMESDLAECFESKNRQLIHEIDALENRNETLRQELQRLTEQESPLVALNKKQADCLEDLGKFRQTIQLYQQKKDKLQLALGELETKLETQAQGISQLHAEKQQVQQVVDAQEISPADIDRMNSERQKLSEVLQDLNMRIEEMNKLIWQKEIEVQPKIDAIEQLVQDFNSRCYKLGIDNGSSDSTLPTLGKLKFDPTSAAYENMLSLDIHSTARPLLSNLRVSLNAKFLKTENDRMAVQEALDSINEAMQEKKDGLDDLETQRLRLENKWNEEKDRMNKENVAHSNEIEILEREIDRIQQENAGTVLHWQQKAQRTTLEFNRLSRLANERRETANNELIKALSDVIAFKGYVEKHLTDLQTIAQTEAEASRELDRLE
ncbi:kinetochore-associated Ndc80 complex subunit ndc80 [Dispira parvispora]|uniref:Kinetochore protein NDC80 n=1 Tax=Dispira parvispora TaxID=1520584 RepID=A0A9W8AXG8_9FUNG|nr:kinetochore-associated Ndc80 complex subunit ndc80 [Dispira parvispora]